MHTDGRDVRADGTGADVKNYTVEDVNSFLNEKHPEYAKLLGTVMQVVAEAEKQLGSEVVRTTYTRQSKQAKSNLTFKDCKAPEKIAKKAQRLGAGQGLANITDIIGITVVVYYPDQIDVVYKFMADALKGKYVGDGGSTEKKERGYYARHIDFLSEHTAHRGLYCEVQIKTMLHDAWAAKTHDLTYKPQGIHDNRLDRMMSMFAETLQAVDVMSETLRDMIKERWAIDKRWRKALQKTIYTFVPAWTSETDLSEEGRDVRQWLLDNGERLAGLDRDDGELQDIAGKIDKVANQSPRHGYLLDGYFALMTDHEDDRERACRRALEWLRVATDWLKADKAQQYDVWSVPLMLQACGNLELAIKASGWILDEAEGLPEDLVKAVSFNLANFLVDQACYGLPTAEEEQVALKARIVALIEAARDLEQKDDTPFLDLKGMIKVAFSNDAGELREAIEMIEKANRNAPPEERDAAQAYYDLNIRLAWRRLLEVESREAPVRK